MDWTSVMSVSIYANASSLTCPICLDTIQMMKSTACGHFFCWICILHYLDFEANKKCPLCWKSGITPSSLKRVVRAETHFPVTIAQKMTMCLLERSKNSSYPKVVLKRNRVKRKTQTETVDKQKSTEKPLVSEKQLVPENLTSTDNLKSADSLMISEQLIISDPISQKQMHIPQVSIGDEKPRVATRKGHEESGGVSTSTKISNEDRIPRVHEVDAPYARIQLGTISYVKECIQRDIVHLEALCSESGEEQMYVEQALRLAKEEVVHHIPVHSTEEETRVQDDPLPDYDGSYLFYQLDNGEYGILHPFNLKCLQTEYSILPNVITGPVVHVETIVITEDNKSRYRFLNHLPLYAEFQLCELNLSNYLSPSTKKVHAVEFKRRKRNRMDKIKLLKRQVQMTTDAEMAAMLYAESQVFVNTLCDIVPSKDASEEEKTKVHEIKEQAPLDVSSFAAITTKNGHFPLMSEAPPPLEQPPSAGAWGSTANLPTPPPPPVKMKKGKRSKGTSLFSTSHRRGYNP